MSNIDSSNRAIRLKQGLLGEVRQIVQDEGPALVLLPESEKPHFGEHWVDVEAMEALKAPVEEV